MHRRMTFPSDWPHTQRSHMDYKQRFVCNVGRKGRIQDVNLLLNSRGGSAWLSSCPVPAGGWAQKWGPEERAGGRERGHRLPTNSLPFLLFLSLYLSFFPFLPIFFPFHLRLPPLVFLHSGFISLGFLWSLLCLSLPIFSFPLSLPPNIYSLPPTRTSTALPLPAPTCMRCVHTHALSFIPYFYTTFSMFKYVYIHK